MEGSGEHGARPSNNEECDLDLSLSIGSPTSSVAHLTPPSSNPPQHWHTQRRRANRSRRNQEKSITPPFPWATNRCAVIHSFSHLVEAGIRTISGEVQCKRCEACYQIEYDLHSKFMEVGSFISANKHAMCDRAPNEWMNPRLPDCRLCGEKNCVKPVISERKKDINWLFLLLGQLLGCCTLEQLRYFCKHTENHRTGAKNRVLYYTYLGICKQLDSTGPFDVAR